MTRTFTEEDIIDAWCNEGFIYCVSTSSSCGEKRVKIGKTKMNRREEVETALLKRYSGEHTVIQALMQVGNVHDAMVFVRDQLRHVPHDKEGYEIDVGWVCNVFDMTRCRYPTREDMLAVFPCLEERVEMETRLNKTIRALELDEMMPHARRRVVRYAEVIGAM